MKTFVLVRKELKELLSEKTIVIGVVLLPLVLFPFLGITFSLVGESTQERESGISMVVVDIDRGKYATLFIQALEKAGFRVNVVHEEADDVREFVIKSGSEVVLIIHQGFTRNLSDGKPAAVDVYVYVTTVSFNFYDQISSITGRVAAANTMLGEALASESFVQLSFYKDPVKITGGFVYRDRIVSSDDAASLFQSFFATSFFVPLVLFIVVATSGTIAATSIGLEKEAKTLEMLLTMPISRSSILTAKLLGSTAIALMGTASMIFGLTFYISNLPIPAAPTPGLMLQFSPVTMALLGLLLFVSLVATLGLGILAGVLAGDVRGGQQLAGLLQMPLIFPPMLLLLFVDFSALPQPVSFILLLNPFTHLMLALQALNAGDYATYFLHLAGMAVFMTATLLLASTLFKGERLLTMRLKISRKTQTV
ncbi:MAG: ABC transporter permease [Candidatus Caldarchaeum sp.]|nr:ABC transporter permease [Candidatus Caldarchaeum sp.]MDW8435563.1 ABC transporter permease [Candidatus Caldarchaeum sp.]